MAVQADELLEIAGEVLSKMGIEGTVSRLTYVAKVSNEWRVNFVYRKTFSWVDEYASFAVHAVTEQITGMWADRVWK